MNEKLKELYEKRKKALADARKLKKELFAKAEGESRALSGDEEAQIAKATDDYKRFDQEIAAEKALLEDERSAEEGAETAEDLQRTTPEQDLEAAERGDPEAQERFDTRAFEMFIVSRGDRELRDRYHDEMELVSRAIAEGGPETRALQMDQDIYGGYMVAPQRVASRFIQAVDNAFPLRQFAHTEQLVGAHSLGAVSLDTDPDDADWTAEVGSITFDSSMAFGGRELKPHDLSKGIKVSLKLLRHSSRPIEALIRERQSYKIGVPLETAAMTGSGAGKPLGCFTASSSGISTSRDVSTSNTTTAPTFDNAKTAKYTLKAQYWPRARWLMHRDTALKYALIKDGNGQYIWQEGGAQGNEPPRLFGFPVSLSEYAPNTFTTGQYVALLGDFQNYWFADSLGITFTRLNELYRANRQIGFLVEGAWDGMPVLEEAFVRVQLA